MPSDLISGHRRIDCGAVGQHISALATSGEEVPRRARLHVETCLRCQSEVLRYRRLRRDLQALRSVPIEPDPEFVSEILAAIDAVSASGAGGRRAAVVGGLSVATAGAAGVLVWASRRRMSLAG